MDSSTCFQNMLIIVTCASHIQHTRILISSFNLIEAGFSEARQLKHRCVCHGLVNLCDVYCVPGVSSSVTSTYRCIGRDYTNPYLPVNPTAMEGVLQEKSSQGPDGKKKEPESNVLFASLENMQYAVTVDVLNTLFNFTLLLYSARKQVFSAFGTVQKIAIFEKNGQTQALVQYPGMPINVFIGHVLLILWFAMY
uniref:Uncharacterized protein n=1 Tax=Solanum lycopersicum TaxID=4081 RepID=A0A3Q7FWQ0_SOLLC